MKTFVILAALGFACFPIIACSEKQPATMGQAEQTETQASTQVASSDAAEVAEIDGRLVQTDKGLAVVTGTDAYVVAGKDLSDMIGKLVKVTGAIAEVDGGQVIEVMTVTPMD